MYALELAEAIKEEADNQLWEDFKDQLKYKRERVGSGKNKGKKRKKPKDIGRKQTDRAVAVFAARQSKGSVSGNDEKAKVIIPISPYREKGYNAYAKTRTRKYEVTPEGDFALAKGGYNKYAKSDVADAIIERAFSKVAKKNGITRFTIKRSGR